MPASAAVDQALAVLVQVQETEHRDCQDQDVDHQDAPGQGRAPTLARAPPVAAVAHGLRARSPRRRADAPEGIVGRAAEAAPRDPARHATVRA